MKKYSVILPCAGHASRLNIPFSKALFPIGSNKTLIDNVFDMFQEIENKPKFVIVINENNTDIVRYLFKYNSEYDIAFIFQKQNEKDLIGAVKSASFEFSDYNVVLLPDTSLVIGREFKQYIQDLDAKLKSKDIVFTVTTRLLNDELLELGLVVYEMGFNSYATIKNIIDKPKELNLKMINEYDCYGAWASFAFTKEIANVFLQSMGKNLSGLDFASENNSLLENMDLVLIEKFTDLGDWRRLYEFFKHKN